jgi:hypothetical protein
MLGSTEVNATQKLDEIPQPACKKAQPAVPVTKQLLNRLPSDPIS